MDTDPHHGTSPSHLPGAPPRPHPRLSPLTPRPHIPTPSSCVDVLALGKTCSDFGEVGSPPTRLPCPSIPSVHSVSPSVSPFSPSVRPSIRPFVRLNPPKDPDHSAYCSEGAALMPCTRPCAHSVCAHPRRAATQAMRRSSRVSGIAPPLSVTPAALARCRRRRRRCRRPRRRPRLRLRRLRRHRPRRR